MKHLKIFLKGYRKECALAPAFKLLEALMDLLVPLVVAAIIDQGIAIGDKGVIIKYFIILIIFAALGMGFSFTAQWFAAKASVGVATDLRQNLFDHIQSLSYTELDTLGTDTLITRMTSDVNQVQNGLNLALRLILRSPFIVFGAMIMAFTIDIKCALIFVASIPVLSLVVFGIMLASIPLFKKAQNGLDQLLGITRENLTGVRVIRAFCKEEEEINEFDQRNQSLTKMNEFVGRLSAIMNPGTYLIINVATIVLIYIGALRVDAGLIQQGQIVALYNYMAQIIVELIKLANLIININKSLACADRLSNILEIKSGMEFPETSPAIPANGLVPEDMVKFNHVTFSYAGSGDVAVSDIDFSVKKGQTVGIIGGTGSGKSTIVNLISRFYDVSQGSIEVDGRNVKDYAQGHLIEKIGLVPQRAVLFEGTIRDNLLWGNENASDEELWQAIDIAQAREVVEGKDGQLDADVEQGGRNLSGGQKQRLTIARALVRKPEILIMDDSSSALDFATDFKLRKAVAQLKDMTVFIVSQRTSSVRNSDQIIVLDDGKLAGLGKHDDLLATCDVYQEIYYSQFPEEAPAEWRQKIGKNIEEGLA